MTLDKLFLWFISSGFFSDGAITNNFNPVIYGLTDNMSCTSTEKSKDGSMTKISCAVLCSKSDKLCLGFGHSGDNCELCYGGTQSSRLLSLNSNYKQYSSSVVFAQELNKGMYFYHSIEICFDVLVECFS